MQIRDVASSDGLVNDTKAVMWTYVHICPCGQTELGSRAELRSQKRKEGTNLLLVKDIV